VAVWVVIETQIWVTGILPLRHYLRLRWIGEAAEAYAVFSEDVDGMWRDGRRPEPLVSVPSQVVDKL
jgi:hypothetical protein